MTPTPQMQQDPNWQRQVSEQLREIRSSLDTLNTKLFGDPDTENPHGRIPKLEQEVEEVQSGPSGMGQLWKAIRGINRTIYLGIGGGTALIAAMDILLRIRFH